MHHPGPPRFTAVDETIELAPRDPDPDGRYRWRISRAPARSRASVGNESVETFTPDVAGTYTLTLDATDGRHDLTVRAFPTRRGLIERRSSGGRFGSPSARSAGEDTGRPRVRLDGDLEGGTVVLRATPRAHPESDVSPGALDVEFVVDDRDEAPLEVDGHEARIRLADLDGPARVHAVAVGESYSVPDAVRVRPDGTVERLNDPPDWATGITLYEVYVRGFAGEDSRPAFEAIGDRLDYLVDLGITAVWLTPVLQNDDADHGYNITDFFAIAEDLGTREAFEAFVERAHEHGIRVLFDLVLNHSARQHPYFERAAAGDPTYRAWYEWNDDGTPKSYFDWEKVANFDFGCLDVRRHLLDVVDEWAGTVDGFRCDMAWAVPRPFWTEIRERVRRRDAEFLLLDETIPYIPDFHDLAFDVHFDTTLYFKLRQIGRGHEPASAVVDAVEQRAAVGFPDHAAFMLYLENHDETRYIEECGAPETRTAAAAQFTLPGVPMLYSGQELGMRDRRGPVRWADGDTELRAHYERLIETRDAIPALQYHGDFDRVTWEADSPGIVAYAREAGDERYVVVLNFGWIEEPVGLPEETVEPVDVVTGDDLDRSEDGRVVVDTVAVLPAER